MAVLIDCYNLLHATMPPSLAGLDELRLCRLLSRGRFAGERVVVVCDGKPKPHAPEGTLANVSLVYSGPGRSADDVIIDLIERDTTPRRLMVVTSDREIQAAARRRRATVLSSDQFVQVLAHGSGAIASDESPGPTEPLTEEQVERWLREFGIDGDTPLGDKAWWE